MKRLHLHRRHRHWVAATLFVALLWHSMIPAGFMPASDGSFSLTICHSGFLTRSGPDPAGHAGGHPDGHSHVEFCPFGALPGAAPISDVPAFLLSSAITSRVIADIAAPARGARFERSHPARGPPLLA